MLWQALFSRQRDVCQQLILFIWHWNAILRTQQIIAYEPGIPEDGDPLAGSHVVEELTDRLERGALAMIAVIDEQGGAVAAIEKGYQEREIARSAYEFQNAVERGEQVIVGVNRFTIDEPDAASLQAIDTLAVKAQLRRLRRVKAERSDKDIHRALESLKSAAQINDNLLPPILDAVRVYAILGEISDALREVFGEYKSK